MTVITKKFPNGVYLLEKTEDGVERKMLVKESDVVSRKTWLQQRRTTLTNQLDADINEMDALIVEIQGCSLEEETVTEEEASDLNLSSVMYGGKLRTTSGPGDILEQS